MESDCNLSPDSPEISELFGDNFLRLNKYFIQVFGLINSVVLCNLKEKDVYFRRFKQGDGEFFLDKKSQEKELNLSPHLLREAIKNLIELNLIKVERKGIPPRYWYKVNYNEIKKVIDLYRSKTSTFIGQNNGPIINNIKNNNIKNNKKDIGAAASQQTPIDNENECSLDDSKQTLPKAKLIDKTLQRKGLKVLLRLNQIGNKHYQTKSPGIKHIIARLKDGYSVQECIKVLETKIQDPWFKENPKYFRPSTLFCPKNFEDYLQEDPTQYKKQNKGPSNGSGLSGMKYDKPGKVAWMDIGVDFSQPTEPDKKFTPQWMLDQEAEEARNKEKENQE